MERRKWIVDLIGSESFERLATGLSGSQFQSLALEVIQTRAAARTHREVLTQFERDTFCRPAAVDPRTALRIDAELFGAASGFEAVELSPVAPLGACSTFALTHQNRVLSALRATEVVADPTNVLALECALRLRGNHSSAIHLATSHRVLRAQTVPNHPGFTQHFRLFALASAGDEQENHAMTVQSLVEHIRTMLRAMDRLEEHGYAFRERRVDILATDERAELGDRIAAQLSGAVARKKLEHAYYSGGLRYSIWAAPPQVSPAGSSAGQESPAGAFDDAARKARLSVPLADGGAFDWLAKLTSNRRATYLASGIGAQLIAFMFRSPASRPAGPDVENG
jgi:hypothetical protein